MCSKLSHHHHLTNSEWKPNFLRSRPPLALPGARSACAQTLGSQTTASNFHNKQLQSTNFPICNITWLLNTSAICYQRISLITISPIQIQIVQHSVKPSHEQQNFLRHPHAKFVHKIPRWFFSHRSPCGVGNHFVLAAIFQFSFCPNEDFTSSSRLNSINFSCLCCLLFYVLETGLTLTSHRKEISFVHPSMQSTLTCSHKFFLVPQEKTNQTTCPLAFTLFLNTDLQIGNLGLKPEC